MLSQNLEALKIKYPKLVKKLVEIEGKGKFEIRETKTGSKTARLTTDDNSFLIHSKYNPEKEADRMVDQVNFDGLNSIIVLGFGLGYHILDLFKKVKDKNIKIFVIENNLPLFKEALCYNNFVDVFKYDNFYLFLQEKAEEDEIYEFINSKIDIVFENIEFFCLPSIFKYSKDYYNFSLKEIRESVERIALNKNTVAKRGKNWKEYLLKNLELVVNKPGFDNLKGILNSKPAIIVSAGPSLNKNMLELKTAKGKALIVAVNTALKPLLRNDIIPDVVITLEEKDDLIDHLCNLEEIEGVTEKDLKDLILAFDPRVKPEVLRRWKGPLLQVVVDFDEHIISWLETYIEFKGRTCTGGSVAHAAFGFVYQLGADPIIFVGQDLAFSETNTHVKGAPGKGSIEEDRRSRENDYLKIKDINGELVWTRNDYYRYLKFFNRLLKGIEGERKYIDATEGGALIEGTELMTLRRAIEEYCQERINIKDKLLMKIKSFNPQWDKELIISLEALIKQIKEVKKYAQEGLDLVDELIFVLSSGKQNKIKKISREIKEINSKINELRNSLMFFEDEIYDFHLKRDFITEDSLKIASNFVDFYNRLISGSDRTLNMLEKKLLLLKETLDEEDY